MPGTFLTNKMPIGKEFSSKINLIVQTVPVHWRGITKICNYEGSDVEIDPRWMKKYNINNPPCCSHCGCGQMIPFIPSLPI